MPMSLHITPCNAGAHHSHIWIYHPTSPTGIYIPTYAYQHHLRRAYMPCHVGRPRDARQARPHAQRLYAHRRGVANIHSTIYSIASFVRPRHRHTSRSPPSTAMLAMPSEQVSIGARSSIVGHVIFDAEIYVKRRPLSHVRFPLFD